MMSWEEAKRWIRTAGPDVQITRRHDRRWSLRWTDINGKHHYRRIAAGDPENLISLCLKFMGRSLS